MRERAVKECDFKERNRSNNKRENNNRCRGDFAIL